MQIRFQETSSVLILDLVSKFFSKLLEKDPNASHYLKYWGSFRQLLSTPTLSVSSVISFISNLDPPGAMKPLDPSPLRTFQSFDSSFDFTSKPQLNKFIPSVNSPRNNEDRGHRRISPSPDEKVFPWHLYIPIIEPTSLKYSPYSSPPNFLTTSTSETPSPTFPKKNWMNQRLSNMTTQDTSIDYGKDKDSFHDEHKGKYELGKLTALAKNFKNKVERTNNNIINKTTKPMYEYRSPLRQVAYYEKKNNYSEVSMGYNPSLANIEIASYNIAPTSYRPQKYY